MGATKKALTRPQMRAIWDDFKAAGYNVVEYSRRAGVPRTTAQGRIRRVTQALKRKVPAMPHPSPGNKLPIEPLIEAWRAYVAAGYNARAAARSVNMNMRKFASRLDAARVALGLNDAGQPELDARERQRLQDKIADLEAKLKKAHREGNAEEDFRKAVFALASQPVTPPRWTVDVKSASGSPGVPILFASDFQWGEVIRAEELDGINAFNLAIAQRRYKLLIERTIDLCKSHMVRPNYPGIIYLRGGDMISGEIHQELRETNEAQSIAAVLDLTAHETAGIKALAEAFGKVWVVSVPGNHGRTTIKPFAKQYVETNYDYLSACMLEREFKGDDRIQFHTPLSGDAIFTVFGFRFLMTHGDRIGSSGGQGFIGPAATIARGMKKLADYYAGLGQPIDHQLVGHFHTRLELEYGFSNGSLPGYGEYPKMHRMKVQPPEQWLLFVHPKHGITCRWPVQLEPRPRLAAATVKAFDTTIPPS